MKLTTYIATILILSVTLVCLVSAVGVSDQSTPGQQNPPNISRESFRTIQPDTQKAGMSQSVQQAGGQNGMQPTPPSTQYTPGISQTQTSQHPGTGGTEITRQPASQPNQESHKTSPAVPTQDMRPNEPISSTVPPTHQLNEPGQYRAASSSSGFPGTYQNILFPPTYPHVQPDNAAIQVTSSPVGASVYLDGSYQGTTPSSGYLDISDLSPGTFTIRLTSSGYADYSTKITLSRNEVATISADLTKAYLPSAYGALSLQSDPSGADVYLDNEYKVISPLTLQGVAIGSHSILIKKDGYSEYCGEVHIVSDQASGLSVTLTGIVTVAPTSVPTQPPAPMPTTSPVSPWAAVCGLTLAGLSYAVRRNHP